jgi:hypothetical protein
LVAQGVETEDEDLCLRFPDRRVVLLKAGANVISCYISQNELHSLGPDFFIYTLIVSNLLVANRTRMSIMWGEA